ncbi:conserved hypothetical protein [Hyphomicrobiales bacterium]|nr:conserved hypothetical protein [Hyphomicrobiales bacterium]CAH1696210.1 conserved hypothetical protein [Hyphomicrobiales bacterium]
MLLEIEAVADSALEGATLSQETSLQSAPRESSRRSATPPSFRMTVPELAFFIVAAFRRHPHINNVLTHISGGSWNRIEEALRVIVDPDASPCDLSPLARNIIDLICADRGVTGRIVKPYYRELLVGALGETVARHLITYVTCLFVESEAAAWQIAPPRPAIAVTSSSKGVDG